MSYARWGTGSTGSWYAFYNVSGYLSLWYSLNEMRDIGYEDCLVLTAEKIKTMYNCTIEESQAAMEYVKLFIKDYDPNVKTEMMKIGEMK